MSRYDDFIRRVEVEAEEEGPAAVAELKAFRDYYRVGSRLAARRRQLEWTQAYLSGLTGIRQSEISRIERAVGNPTLLTLSRLASALSIELWSQEPEAERPPRSEEPADFTNLMEWIFARGLLTSLPRPRRRAVLLWELQRRRHIAGPSLQELEKGSASPVEGWLSSLDQISRLSEVLDAALVAEGSANADECAAHTEAVHVKR